MPTHLHPLLIRTLTQDLGVPEGLLHAEATLEDLGLDSLALAELAVIVEDRTGRSVADLTERSTLAQVSERLADLGQGGPEPGA
ncbi:acyl carrier protein [Streptomyces caatingaensis]|uniref:Carrier domain-containing protein n=1 Tax=Streptomyces caatingaensis TaxID=1678637 RepID=A0A0K9XMD1_9ACTN|nr:acyl carrier protein [Streptomyces caatingaensis]KNB53862.1 hypothetical protein AC230_04555 [Streptomyces caatingaensis]